MSAVLFAAIANVQCYKCGVVFGLEQGFQAQRREDHQEFYCPNGHAQWYSGKTDKEREIERLGEELRSLTANRDYHQSRAQRQTEAAETARRQAAAARGVVTKVKRRIGKGVCPCCNRYFRDLHQHMTGEHPDWSQTDA